MESGSPLFQFVETNQLLVPSRQLVVAPKAADTESAKAVMAIRIVFLVNVRGICEVDFVFLSDEEVFFESF